VIELLCNLISITAIAGVFIAIAMMMGSTILDSYATFTKIFPHKPASLPSCAYCGCRMDAEQKTCSYCGAVTKERVFP